MTLEITDEDRRAAREGAADIAGGMSAETVIAEALAEARAAGYEAGLAEGQDDAHASGYREAVAEMIAEREA